jgi:hypothetical protein
MRSKKGTFVPKKCTIVPDGFQSGGLALSFAEAISAALRRELGNTSGAIKIVMRWTGASERTVKYWFTGERGPSGEHLVLLAAHSDAVFRTILVLAGRNQNLLAPRWHEAWTGLKEAMDRMRAEIEVPRSE